MPKTLRKHITTIPHFRSVKTGVLHDVTSRPWKPVLSVALLEGDTAHRYSLSPKHIYTHTHLILMRLTDAPKSHRCYKYSKITVTREIITFYKFTNIMPTLNWLYWKLWLAHRPEGPIYTLAFVLVNNRMIGLKSIFLLDLEFWNWKSVASLQVWQLFQKHSILEKSERLEWINKRIFESVKHGLSSDFKYIVFM